MPAPKYRVELLDSALVPITRVQNLVPLDTNGNFLEYQSKLSQYGQAKFRIETKDPMFTQFGNILVPYANHVRIYRSGILVWSGVIIKVPHRTKRFIEIQAHTYLYLLSKKRIQHDASVTSGDGKDNYRTFSTGTMATAIQTVLTEAKGNVGATSILSSLKVGTLENPNFPSGYVDANGTAVTGTWTFSSAFTLQFDYRDILYVLSQLGLYSNSDFELVYDGTNLTFNFKKFIGNRQPDIMFEYGNWGAIEDYDLPLDGDRMANDLVGVAADYTGKILHIIKTDEASIKKYGRVEGVAAYNDVKNQNALTTHLVETLSHVSLPDGEIVVDLNERAYPLGQYGLGDLVTIKIKDHIIDVNEQRRIVGINVAVHVTGKESIRLFTNAPKGDQ